MPAVSNMTPDKDKLLLLKKYNKIAEINTELLDNSQLYFTKNTGDRNFISCLGLGCTQIPVLAPYNTASYGGNQKYGKLLASMLGVKNSDVTASSNNVTFKTEDGTAYKVTFSTETKGTYNTVYGGAWLYISLSGDTTFPLYANNNKKPKGYKFIVKTDGSIIPCNDDPLAAAYIKNSTKTNNKKADYELAKELKGTLPTEIFD
jgi:hypothetical protein